MTEEQLEDFVKIRNLLKRGYDHYFELSEGYCKSGEGAIEVYYGNYFDSQDSIEATGIGIYSYVLGPSRMHHWFRTEDSSMIGQSNYHTKWVTEDPIKEALSTVTEWVREEMEDDHKED